MIIDKDPNKYKNQLTKWFPAVDDLKFATKMFENSNRHCIIKKSKKGYAVFTDGRYMARVYDCGKNQPVEPPDPENSISFEVDIKKGDSYVRGNVGSNCSVQIDNGGYC